jgi:hypothetical protein
MRYRYDFVYTRSRLAQLGQQVSEQIFPKRVFPLTAAQTFLLYIYKTLALGTELL